MASIWERVKNIFKSREEDEIHFYDETPFRQPEARNEPVVESSDSRQQVISPESEQPARLQAEVPEVAIPYWLEDEDTLRDEGVLFGLSESGPEEKTDIIRSYFDHKAADFQREIEAQNEQIQELNLFIGQKENRIDELQGKVRMARESSDPGEHYLPRTLVGLALSIAMCIGNYSLIEEAIRPAYANSGIIAMGVFLAGMFNLFGRISLLHEDGPAVSRRRLLEEIGMPLAAALFVFAQAWQQHTWWQATALFVFVFFLFLFAGKLLLSNITMLRNDLRIWLKGRKGTQSNVSNVVLWEGEMFDRQKEMDELRAKKWQHVKWQNEAETEQQRLFARRDMLIKLFESEFYLARKMRGTLSEKQLRAIQGK